MQNLKMEDFFEKISPSKEIEEEKETQEGGELAVDVYQTEEEFVVVSTIAGVDPEDLEIEIHNDTVSIKGERKKIEEVPEKDYLYQECFWGSFSRSIVLPEEIDPENAKAVLKNGVLVLRLPKIKKVKTFKLKVEKE